MWLNVVTKFIRKLFKADLKQIKKQNVASLKKYMILLFVGSKTVMNYIKQRAFVDQIVVLDIKQGKVWLK